MSLIIALIVGFLAGRMLWLALRTGWHQPAVMRTNYNGVDVPTGAGIVLVLALLLVEAGRAVAAALGVGDTESVTPMRAALLVAVAGFSLLGLVDDLVGSADAKGLSGHLRALVRGKLTTGGLKFVGGGLVALVSAAMITEGLGELMAGAAVIALAANLANLFDLRPGRTTKIGLLAMAGLAIAALGEANLVPVAIVVGAAAALLLEDLRERLMLGDTGANALGATLGLGVVGVTEGSALFAVLGVLVVLNLLSEVVSFSKLFDRLPPLRAFDQLGRRRPAPPAEQEGSDPFEDRPITIDLTREPFAEDGLDRTTMAASRVYG